MRERIRYTSDNNGQYRFPPLDSEFSIHNLLEYLTKVSLSTVDNGRHIERLRNAWLWQDWPDRKGKAGTGIDLVLEERATGDLVVVQCKLFDPRNTLTKENPDSFFTASGQEPSIHE